ncbi:alpha/beta fold hydrolase [Psychromonas aquimarina]|uniref:alpha/beta fold hydrolase n=1 Tax=Psychromonas aquimarina TaxID=444919 RepID=UPI00041102E6|nr:alpha/beta fold hydrolase [Psychromonas aquimarina]
MTYRDTTCKDMLNNLSVPENAACGYFTVPEKHAVNTQPASSKTLDIAVLKLTSSSSSKQLDPVVFLQGGPGASAISSIEAFTQSPAKFLLADRDVYLVDQRGTGYSKPALTCTEYQGEAGTFKQVKACKERLTKQGIDFTAYQSVQSAYDFISLRKVLKLESWNLYGVSYGTRLAATIMREDPSGIRSVILDGVFPIEVNGISDTPWSVYAALDRVIENCRTSLQCNPAELKQTIESIILRLQNYGREREAEDFIKLVQNALGETDPDLLTIIEAINQDLDLIKKLTDANKDNEKFYAPMALSIVCSEEYPYLNQTALAGSNNQNWSTTTHISADKIRHMGFDEDSCKAWNIKAADSIETEPVTSNLPTLILNGANDPQTPPAWGHLAAKNIPYSQVFTNPHGDHGQLFSENIHRSCIDKVIQEFLISPTKTVTTRCTKHIPEFSYN